MRISRGFHGNCIILCGDSSILIQDLKEGDEVPTGSERCPTAIVRKVHYETGSGRVVNLRPGLSVADNHPVKTAGGENEGNWQRAAEIKHSEVRYGTWYNIELAGHVDSIIVSGIICSVMGTYCGPRIGWDEYTRKTVRCAEEELHDTGDEFNHARRRCIICDIVCDEQSALGLREPKRRNGMQTPVPRSLRQAVGHACIGEYTDPVIQDARL